ncbi:CHAT domain-containing protein [Dyadobacter bucti]|uniref:CHAT domain-containing protein n=1 Tax=Dyadobacter bucti TaxID=2572203 RepID=UPI00110958BF|nr:CHAT domain-containing protein [Dyadobacter bucti]
MEREGIGLTPALKKGGVYASEVVKLLKPHEAAVEILHVNGGGHKDYYALVIIQGWKSPKVIVMGNSTEMTELLSDESTDLPAKINKVYAIDSRTYQLCWEGVQKVLPPTVKTVYLSAAGVYEGLSFAAISGAAGKRVGDTYQIRYVVSTSEIAEKTLMPSKTITSRSALLLGNVLYSCPESPGQLPGRCRLTGPHVDSLIKKAKAKSTLLHQSAATENSLAGLDLRSYDIIHFATHGDFTNRTPDDLKFSRRLTIYQNSEAFLRLAASDCAKKVIKEKSEDGILTATEITSYMDLNAELVVLSACNSAIGTSQGSEGMFGLFRAFKSAGVKKVIATLWEVDDKRTAEFMKYFYTNLFKPSATVESAFETTQLFVRKSLGWTPYEYGGLVLLN